MISIIIPTLNEEAQIGKLLEHLLANSLVKITREIIIVDGGSQDNTKRIVQDFSNFTNTTNKKAFNYIDNSVIDKNASTDEKTETAILLLNSEKGRAKQMNLGAKMASGDILYFLHADSFPPKKFDQHILSQVKKGNEAGCFRMQFDSSHWWLRLASWFTKFNWRVCRGGDQSQFITKELFNSIGQFNESYSVYEDNILINELYARKQFVVINKKLKSSARMYRKHGVWKLQYFYWNIYLKKWLGASANDIYSYYKKNVG
ncbi:TIGR04283 family arsenosugar biosynthesis glycosyltransferase [Algibacter pectinivorans]|uniref:Transferase 2, rSAM/selenodomain-associated n=1 Tax=Algibacter pectinivorans TaxID=870482 RepID=A0A1I1MMV6_9FLAO|nr:TIGR04283 family arsenosugar biosynthesis glycosyltransferase [Algibacter pectinivorans]SFC83943.1 transferase 2, rSAM/selenodomain-associated [Algibacter pectinivorans]